MEKEKLQEPHAIKELAARYNEELKGSPAHEVVRFFLEQYKDRAGFASSLGAEDQVITEMISGIDRKAYIFTLDTGRMFPETYDLIDITSRSYKVRIKICFPDATRVEEMVANKGINLFYESIENRQLCCHIRKIEPMRKALSGLEVWISGIRKDQSITRKQVRVVEYDQENKLIKVNPLANWTEDEVWNYIREKDIPYNKLHDQGFPSIGCQPCTRAIEPGEDIRAGRWWWENPDLKECGLHK
jgi:phosphoadenosine phosphosulfate reductase